MAPILPPSATRVAPGIVWERVHHRVQVDALQVRNRYRRFLVEQIRYQALSSHRPELFARLVQLLTGQAVQPLAA